LLLDGPREDDDADRRVPGQTLEEVTLDDAPRIRPVMRAVGGGPARDQDLLVPHTDPLARVDGRPEAVQVDVLLDAVVRADRGAGDASAVERPDGHDLGDHEAAHSPQAAQVRVLVVHRRPQGDAEPRRRAGLRSRRVAGGHVEAGRLRQPPELQAAKVVEAALYGDSPACYFAPG